MKANSKIGTVYLVGAGPGHPELITLLGHRLLNTCDAVAYDDLSPYEVVAELPPQIERHYVGKRSGKHSQPQAETNDLLAQLALEGKTVVRLKGGDPSIFGRGGEELDVLHNQGIPVVIVPGVTAATAAAAGLGVSLTDRRYASWLMLATGHEAISTSPSVPWDSIAKLNGGTLVVYMGLNALGNLVRQLLDGGAPALTPTAVVSNAYLGNQKAVFACLTEIEQKSRDSLIESPALIIIGDVAGDTRPHLLLQPKPLEGKRVLVMRPLGLAGKMCTMLRENGAIPIPLPTISIESHVDTSGWEKFLSVKSKGGWLIFTSESGVDHFLTQLVSRGMDMRSLGMFRIAAVGSGTSSALTKWNLLPDLVPDKATVAQLALALVNSAYLKGVNVVRVRGNLGDNTIEQAATDAGAHLIPMTVYNNTIAVWDDHWIKSILENPPDYMAFTSGSTVDGLVNILGTENVQKITTMSRVAAIGPSTAEVVRQHNLPVHCIAQVHSVEGLVDEIRRDASQNAIG